MSKYSIVASQSFAPATEVVGMLWWSEVLSKKKKKKDTSASALQKKKVFTKIFQSLHKISTNQKIVLSSSRWQANFRGLEASRPGAKDFKMCPLVMMS